MTVSVDNLTPEAKPQRHKKQEKIFVRLESVLADRLRQAAIQSGIPTSDKVRRILDAHLPLTP